MTNNTPKEEVIYKGNKFIRGDIIGYCVPEFPEYINTKATDWYWKEGSKKEENRFIWKDTSLKDTKEWLT